MLFMWFLMLLVNHVLTENITHSQDVNSTEQQSSCEIYSQYNDLQFHPDDSKDVQVLENKTLDGGLEACVQECCNNTECNMVVFNGQNYSNCVLWRCAEYPDCPMIESIGTITVKIGRTSTVPTIANTNLQQELKATTILPEKTQQHSEVSSTQITTSTTEVVTNENSLNENNAKIVEVEGNLVPSTTASFKTNVTEQQSSLTTNLLTTTKAHQGPLSDEEFEAEVLKEVAKKEEVFVPETWLEKLYSDFENDLPSDDGSSAEYELRNYGNQQKKLQRIQNSTTSMSVVLITIIVIGLLLSIILLTVSAKILYEMWVRRKYQKLSGLIDA